MKRKRIGIGIALAVTASMTFGAMNVLAESDYADKELWYYETDNIAWCNYPTMYEHMAAMGLADSDFDIDAYVDSEMGEGVIKLLKNVILYQETDQEVMDYWTDLGIRKELFHEDDAEK